MLEKEREEIKLARRHLETDHHLSVFIVRDLQVVEELGLSDLVWAMFQNYSTRKEVEWLLDELEKEDRC